MSKDQAMMSLTERQKETLTALQVFLDKNGKAPTFNELSRILGFKCSDALKSLRKRHLITWGTRQPRSLTILNHAPKQRIATVKVARASRVELQDTLPAPSLVEGAVSRVTEGPPSTRGIFRTFDAPLDFLNHKTIQSVEQSGALQLIMKFTDDTSLRVEVQAHEEEEPTLVMFLSSELRLRRS